MTTTLKKHGLTYTASWLGDEKCSVVASGPNLDAMDLGNLSWPSDKEISKIAGRPVKFFDGGDNLAEALYRPVAK